MKGKKQDREPEYIHWSECVCVCVCVRVCVFVCIAHSPCVCVCFCMCVWVWAMNVPCEGVWKRPDVGCQALLCLSSPSPPTAPGPMMDDGEWEVSSPGLPTAAGCRQRISHLLSIAGAGGGPWFWAWVLATLAAWWGYRDSQASRQGGLQRNEQPSKPDK